MSEPSTMQADMRSVMEGKFEREGRILHIWFPKPFLLATVEDVQAFFTYAQREWIEPTPGRYYLLVDFTNLTIDPKVTDTYAKCIEQFQHKLLGTFRYRVSNGLTATAVRLGNMRLSKSSRIFTSEADARNAIRRADEQRND